VIATLEWSVGNAQVKGRSRVWSVSNPLVPTSCFLQGEQLVSSLPKGSDVNSLD
jgi:hypothetical protein